MSRDNWDELVNYIFCLFCVVLIIFAGLIIISLVSEKAEAQYNYNGLNSLDDGFDSIPTIISSTWY